MAVRLGVWLACVVCSNASAAPTRVKIDLKNEAALTKAGFEREGSATGQTTFVHGKLSLRTGGYEEWTQRTGFADDAGNPPGWAVEARLRLDAPCDKLGPTLVIADGNASLRVQLTDHQLVVYQPALRIDIGPTTAMRTYRVVRTGNSFAILVDGKSVWTGQGAAGSGRGSLMFGYIGGACADNRSTWDYLAYETTPVAPLAWPPRDEWHPAVTADALLAALAPATRVPARVAPADVPCIAIFALDSATRDLLPLAYDAIGEKSPASDLRALHMVIGPEGIKQAQRVLDDWTRPIKQPVCDPAPGAPCGPGSPDRTPAEVPAIEPDLASALRTATQWGEHPFNAELTTDIVARAYVAARVAKVPGAAAAAERLGARLAALATHPARCGL